MTATASLFAPNFFALFGAILATTASHRHFTVATQYDNQKVDEVKAHCRANALKYSRNVSIKTIERNYSDRGEIAGEIVHAFVSNSDHFKLTSTTKIAPKADQVGHTEIWIGNPSGMFHIVNSKRGYLINKSTKASDDWTSICRADMGLSLPFAKSEITLDRYLELKDLTVRSVNEATWQGQACMKIGSHRTIRKGVDETSYFETRKGLYMGGELRFANGHGANYVVRYSADMHPLGSETFTVHPQKGDRRTRAVEVVEFQFQSHSDDEFSLGQFGLPDPVISNASGRSSYRIVIAIVIPSLIGVLMVLRKRFYRA